MPLFTVQAKFAPCELKFKLTDPEKLTPAIEKKLKALGFPEIWAVPSAKAANLPLSGVTAISDKSIDMSINIPISSPTEGATAECVYSAEDQSVSVKLAGLYDVWTTEDIKPLKNVTCLFISGIRLTDLKGKTIKFAKDEYGMANKVEANVTGTYDENGLCYQVPVSLSIQKD